MDRILDIKQKTKHNKNNNKYIGSRFNYKNKITTNKTKCKIESQHINITLLKV